MLRCRNIYLPNNIQTQGNMKNSVNRITARIKISSFVKEKKLADSPNLRHQIAPPTKPQNRQPDVA